MNKVFLMTPSKATVSISSSQIGQLPPLPRCSCQPDDVADELLNRTSSQESVGRGGRWGGGLLTYF
jgi:hypothetical protein